MNKGPIERTCVMLSKYITGIDYIGPIVLHTYTYITYYIDQLSPSYHLILFHLRLSFHMLVFL